MKKLQVLLFGFYIFSNIGFSQSNNILVHAEQMPYFPGCERFLDTSESKRSCSNEALVAFLADNVQYPPTAKLLGTEGTVYVSFVIDEKGNVTNPSVIRDIGDGCGAAALEVLKKMPAWEPGKEGGIAVKVKLNLPIHFSLKNNNADTSESYDFSIQWGNLKGKKILVDDFRKNIENKIIVRDRFGEPVNYEELTFSYKNGRVFNTSTSNGNVDRKLKRIAKRVKGNGKFYVGVIVRNGSEKVNVGREFLLIK